MSSDRKIRMRAASEEQREAVLFSSDSSSPSGIESRSVRSQLVKSYGSFGAAQPPAGGGGYAQALSPSQQGARGPGAAAASASAASSIFHSSSQQTMNFMSSATSILNDSAASVRLIAGVGL
jgi:hypothetical protein